jgi:hypothetical protein
LKFNNAGVKSVLQIYATLPTMTVMRAYDLEQFLSSPQDKRSNTGRLFRQSATIFDVSVKFVDLVKFDSHVKHGYHPPRIH